MHKKYRMKIPSAAAPQPGSTHSLRIDQPAEPTPQASNSGPTGLPDTRRMIKSAVTTVAEPARADIQRKGFPPSFGPAATGWVNRSNKIHAQKARESQINNLYNLYILVLSRMHF